MSEPNWSPDSGDDDRARYGPPGASREEPTSDGEPSVSSNDHRQGLLDPLLDSSNAGLLGGLAAPDENGRDDQPSGQSGDRWAHRRGEPRVFALLLSMYLLAGAMMTIFSTPVIGSPSEVTFVRAVRTLFILVTIGIGALWPMLRLSQASPKKAVAAALVDVVLVSLLVQAVVWPVTILPGGAPIPPAWWLGLWPWSVSAGIGVLFVSWTVLIGSVIACAIGRRPGWGRAGWMAGCLALTAGAPSLAMIAAHVGRAVPEAVMLASPITAAVRFISTPSGLLVSMDGEEWIAAVTPIVVSAPLWALALVRQRSNRGRSLEGGILCSAKDSSTH